MFFAKTRVQTISMQQAAAALAADDSIQIIDVRSPAEYRQGHIPSSVNLPLDEAQSIQTIARDLNARIFVYCLSGARSRRACALFCKLGYTDVTNMGGISGWSGAIERGSVV